MTNPLPADVTLTAADDGTYAIATAGRTVEIHARLRRAGIGHFLGFDPNSAIDRAEVERRIAYYVGDDLTVEWV